jgi:hypothetical protein
MFALELQYTKAAFAHGGDVKLATTSVAPLPFTSFDLTLID